MTTELKAGDAFPDFELPDHRDELRRLVLRRTSYDRGAAARPARDHADPQRLPLRSVRHPEVKKIRIPQQEWTGGAPPPGANGPEVAKGVVSSFDVGAGFGMISTDASDREVFFSFTAIPGEGYRTLRPGTPISFELVENDTGPTARNIRREKTNDDGRS